MSGNANLFSRLGFSLQSGVKIDNNTRAFFSKFKGRIGPAIPDVALTGNNAQDWLSIATTANAVIAEFVAQGWIQKGFDADAAPYVSGIRAVTMIPAATEFGYAPSEVFHDFEAGEFETVETDNGFSQYAPDDWILYAAGADNLSDREFRARLGNPKCDWKQSLDNLQAALPNVGLFNLFAAWYGTDLRCGTCQLVPGVTRGQFKNYAVSSSGQPYDWSVAGTVRSTAHLISQVNGGAAFGGTPSDQSLLDAIADLKARQLKVCFTPFILMDIPNGNTLPDPYSAANTQAVYPWRGRITCYPGQGQPGTADKTAAAGTQIAAFVTQYRNFVLHYANLCANAGGVDVFLLGTELRGLGWLRDNTGAYPFVSALVQLAADVKAILPNAKLSYAADWSEYFGHQPADGTNDVHFHLDPLWSSPHVDAVSIDNYFPLSDWRDSGPNADGALASSIYDPAYLTGNIRGGEGYAWFYASPAARTAQTRTPITDGTYGKPWVFRFKDIWSWWANNHFDRPGGVESLTATGWAPQSKPIWFTELGCPSIDKGSNQPNVFFDPKSSESAVPYFSTGASDYLIQRRALNAVLSFFDDSDPAFQEVNNPQSNVYAGRMADLAHVSLYTWDARPYPFFPAYQSVWSDAGNWAFGHWLDGKLSTYGNPGALDSMALAQTLAPRHPYIVDPVTGKLDRQYSQFFQAIEFVQGDPIANVPASPTPAEAANAINAILAVMRQQKRLTS